MSRSNQNGDNGGSSGPEVGAVVVVEWAARPGWPIESVSSNVEEVLGYAPADLVGGEVDYRDLVHPDDRDQFDLIWSDELLGDDVSRQKSSEQNGSEQSGATGLLSPAQLHYRVICADGQTIQIDQTHHLARDSAGRPTRCVAHIVDVTARDRRAAGPAETAKALQESRARLAEAQRLAHLGSWQFDIEAGQFRWSDEVYHIFGLDPDSDEVIEADQYLQFIPADEHDHLRRVAAEIWESSEPVQFEHRVLRPDGSLRHVHSRARAVIGGQGQPDRLVGVLQDITERKKVEQLKEEFVSVVSHELRTPLTPITGVLGMLASGGGGELTGRAKQMVDLALRNSHRLLYLIDDLLDIQKMSSGLMEFHIRRLDLADVVAESLRVNRSLEHQHSIKISFDDRAARPKVRGDRGRIMQVMTNLLSNAAKFAPPNSVVRVWLEQTDGQLVRVAVADKGPGIPVAFRKQVFDTFSQADSSSTRKHGGTGLGLSICRAIVERLGGDIGFETNLDEGTTFYVDLPVVAD